jgi:hypothetical protein
LVSGFNIVQVRGGKKNSRFSLFCADQAFDCGSNPRCVTNSFKIVFQAHFHFHGHTVLEKVFLLLYQLGRKVSKALLSEIAMGCAAKIHFWIESILPAFLAFATSFIFKELYLGAAIWTFGVKDSVKFPIARVLSGALHISVSSPSKEWILMGRRVGCIIQTRRYLDIINLLALTTLN